VSHHPPQVSGLTHAHLPSPALAHRRPLDQSTPAAQVHFWPLVSAAAMGSHGRVVSRLQRIGWWIDSNISLGSALKAGNGKEKEASTNNSGKTSSIRSFRRWKSKTYKTNEHAWFECSENPNSKNYKGEKKDETKDKEGGASAVALKLAWAERPRKAVLGRLGWERCPGTKAVAQLGLGCPGREA
jgi:hypothetical protein